MTAYASADRDDERWSAPIIEAFGRLANEIEATYKKRREKDRVGANVWLRDAHEILAGAPKVIRDLHNLDDIDRMARWLADTCASFKTDAQLDAFRLRHRLPPVPGDNGGPRLARAKDWYFWRRVLRKRVARWRDQIMRHLGYVHRFRQMYCCDSIVKWQRQRQRANLELLQTLWAESDAGDLVNLGEIYQASLANPALRRAELLARIRGFERYAEGVGHRALFVTITCPSKYHARHAKTGQPNEKWNGATPRDAQQYLCGVWARIRSALKREEIEVYGFRIAEPHHDGCPHWHALLFHRRDQRDRLERIIRHHATMEDRDELGNSTNKRVKFERIRSQKGSATGYVIKYVSKSIDGHRVGEAGANSRDLYGGTAEAAADRITAWARTWGIRQFQQIGGPAVGVWREYRRINPENATKVLPPHHVVWHTASVEGRWDEFCRHMGGATPGRCQPTLLARAPLLDIETGELRRYRSRYGDLLPSSARPVLGVVREGVTLTTREKQWSIKSCRTNQRSSTAWQTELTAPRAATARAGRPSALPEFRPGHAASSVLRRLIAVVTSHGEAATGIPAGSILTWRTATRVLPPSRYNDPVDPEPPNAVWRLRAADRAAVGPWTRVTNCTPTAHH